MVLLMIIELSRHLCLLRASCAETKIRVNGHQHTFYAHFIADYWCLFVVEPRQCTIGHLRSSEVLIWRRSTRFFTAQRFSGWMRFLIYNY